jgi:hypothetical protein
MRRVAIGTGVREEWPPIGCTLRTVASSGDLCLLQQAFPLPPGATGLLMKHLLAWCLAGGLVDEFSHISVPIQSQTLERSRGEEAEMQKPCGGARYLRKGGSPDNTQTACQKCCWFT